MWKICDFKIEVKPQSLLPAELVSLVVLKMVPLLHAQISFLCESSRKLKSKVTCIGFDGRIVGHYSYSSISQFSPKVSLILPQSETVEPHLCSCRMERFLAAQSRRFSCTMSHAAPSFFRILVNLHCNISSTSR